MGDYHAVSAAMRKAREETELHNRVMNRAVRRTFKMQDEGPHIIRLVGEREALTARVERLEAALRDLIEAWSEGTDTEHPGRRGAVLKARAALGDAIEKPKEG